ncbi:uncharacterized protein N7511_007724 [Penicillium nucicola]|uniref:uncharacterized protein n=1 Tax=Penicillium nucicola TaxID=1850975 RepID=UPI0025452C37|nr:uncharacterized protein N7511_007724 [Penicillium nucicola]KAJ5753571.1 hypothetical protein N7511_007724 [Penicillium nucicola]
MPEAVKATYDDGSIHGVQSSLVPMKIAALLNAISASSIVDIMKSFVSLLLPTSALAGSVLWNGIFNTSDTVADLDRWSWSNQIGAYQWYIHGSGETTEYLGLSTDFKNPAATDAKGLRTSIDGTSFWEGQTMERTELIPQTKSDLGSGHLYYHFSLSTKSTNPPSSSFEHQIAFFESHFTEIQYGSSGSADNTLRWNANGNTQWSVQLEAGNWYNFAYDIDFDAKTVGLWASNGSDVLTEVVKPVTASTSTNSADWHVGVLRLPGSTSDDTEEDWYWSGVYIEEAPITTNIGSGSSSSEASGESASIAQTTRTIQAAAADSTTVAAIHVATTSSALTTTAETSVHSPAVSSVTASSAPSFTSVTDAVSTPFTTSSTTVTYTSSSSPSFPSASTAAEFLEEIRVLIKSLVSRSNSLHSRDFGVPLWQQCKECAEVS